MLEKDLACPFICICNMSKTSMYVHSERWTSLQTLAHRDEGLQARSCSYCCIFMEATEQTHNDPSSGSPASASPPSESVQAVSDEAARLNKQS